MLLSISVFNSKIRQKLGNIQFDAKSKFIVIYHNCRIILCQFGQKTSKKPDSPHKMWCPKSYPILVVAIATQILLWYFVKKYQEIGHARLKIKNCEPS